MTRDLSRAVGSDLSEGQTEPMLHHDRDRDIPAPAATAAFGALDLRWQRSYDQVAVERFMAAVEAERRRLLAEIDEARAAAEASDARLIADEAAAQASLGQLVVDTQREIARMEEEHQERIESIRAAAEAEAERVLESARIEAEAVRSSAAALSTIVDGQIDDAGTASTDVVAAASPDRPEQPAARVDAG